MVDSALEKRTYAAEADIGLLDLREFPRILGIAADDAKHCQDLGVVVVV